MENRCHCRWLTFVSVVLTVLCAVRGSAAGSYPQPAEWICLTTAGEHAVEGGSVNKSRCGAVCDTPEQATQWIGWLGAIIAILFFGSNFVPVKTFDTGDGLFFQWVLCIGIWLTGLAINMIIGQPPFLLPALLGGVLWTTGNLMVVPIVKMIGLTMGLTVWGVTNMLAGWVTGMFILGQSVECPGLNYGGVGLVVISVIILAFVKSEGKQKQVRSNESAGSEHSGSEDEHTSLLEKESKLGSSVQTEEDINDKVATNTPSQPPRSTGQQDTDVSWVDRLGVWPRRVLGFVLSLFSGLLYGFSFVAVEFMKLCEDEEHSCSDIDYLFGYYSGILFVSTFFFVVYAAFRLNKPVIYPKLILPGLISGVMWGIAMCGFFLANQHLSLSISFPICTSGPGFVSSAWGIFVFKEIRAFLFPDSDHLQYVKMEGEGLGTRLDQLSSICDL